METLQHSIDQFKSSFNQKYEPHVREHLARVYMVLASATVATAAGSFLQMSHLLDFGSSSGVLSLLLVLGLHFYRDNGKNYFMRLSMLLAFGFFSGQTLGPILLYALHLNFTILITALGGTAITFGSLSLASLFAERGKYLYLGGLLAIVINTMALVSLVNIFFQIYFVQLAQLYIGIFVMAAFILFDTQNIIEKCRAGNRDVVQHAMDLFFDVLSMFRRLLIILTQKEERKREQARQKYQ